jgi:WD40 repeat protein
VRIVRLVAAGAVLAVAALPGPAWAAYPGENGRIAYTYELTGSNPGDIRTVEPDGSDNRNLTALNPLADRDPAWSPDGTRIAFSSRTAAGEGSSIWTMDADGADKVRVTTGSAAYDDIDPTWLPDGTQRIAFIRLPRDGSCSSYYVVDSDGSTLTPGADLAECRQADLDMGPDPNKVAYYAYDEALETHGLYVDPVAGPPVQVAADGNAPDWAPGARWLAYSWSNGVFRVAHDGSVREPWIAAPAMDPAWSPDGTRVATAGINLYNDAGLSRTQITFHATGNAVEPDWQPLPPLPPAPGHVRPKAAGPLLVSLVPAYEPCVGPRRPNKTHGPPLAYGSCGPPNKLSHFLTVGTADSNGEASQSVGSIRFKPVPGDVEVTGSITDVRCVAVGVACPGGALSDYTGALRARFHQIEFGVGNDAVTITDKDNGGTGNESATASFSEFDSPFRVPLACTPTASITTGSTCAVSTTLNALTPGIVHPGKRAVWQLGAVWVEDGGDDGDPATDGNGTFAGQGIFVP